MFIKTYISFTLLFLFSMSASAQKLRGSVCDDNGEPLASATVVVEGTNYSTLTNDDGEFGFSNLPQGTFNIVASFIGYDPQKQEIAIADHSQQMVHYNLGASNTLNEVEVVGERFKQAKKLEAITRIPLRPSEQIQSISVISEKIITQQGALTITNALRNVAGVSLFGSYGGVKESMTVRGFRGVPVLKNGVRIDSQLQTASGVTDMQGVESIQMIKGSAAITQGVVSDLGNAGGVINVVTKTPKFVNSGQVDLRVGSWGQVRPTFDVQSVLNKDKTAAFRINGAYERADNYRPIVSLNKVYINPSFEWRPDNKTSIVIEADYLNENRTPVTSTANLGPDSVQALYKMPHDKFLGFANDNVNTEVTTYSARLDRELTDNLNFRVAYFGASYNVDNISTGLTVPEKDYTKRKRTLSRNLRDDKNSTFQIDLIGKDVFTGSIKHTFQVGFDYRMANAATRNLGSLVIDTIDVTANRINNTEQKIRFKNPESVIPDIIKYNTYGFTGQEVMTINKYLKTTLGLRYSSISTMNALNNGTSDAKPTVGSAWDPVVGVIVTPLKNINLIGSYTTSTSLRNAGYILAVDSVSTAGSSKTKQFEAGLKSDWLKNRLRFNFTYFNIVTDNLVNPYYAEGTTVASPYYVKAGNLKREGIEVELNGHILENLQLILGYAYLDAQYQNSPSYQDGSAPINTPKHTANGWIQYDVNRGLLKGFAIGAGAYYVGKRPINDFLLKPDGHGSLVGSRPFDMPSFTTVDIQLSYTHKAVTTRLFLNNIFDEIGYNSYYRGGYINQIDPRNFAAAVSYRF